MKKVLFLLFACLLLVALVLPACDDGDDGAVIKIGVIGPMQYTQGQHHWWGAEMARDEINAAGGVKVGDETYMIKLIQADSNEINSTTDAASAMERLITVDNAQFVVGGFRTEAVFPMQEVAMDYKTIYVNCGAATLALNTPVFDDYDRYKYYFRATPFPSNYLVSNVLFTVGMAGAIIKEETGLQRPLKVAICAEGAEWADGMVNALNGLIPSRLGMEVVGIWRPSPTATDCNAEMTAMEAAGADIICTTISGPLGIPYARSWGELEVEAASVGINVESQDVGFWDATAGFGNFETSLSSYGKGVAQSALTVPFVDAFIEKTGEIPNYNAATYDAIYTLKDCIERAGSFDNDAIVAEMEKWEGPTTAAPLFKYTGMDAPLKNPHDVTYGPGNSTGLACQWQDGELVIIWPNADYATDDAWKAVKYPGIVKWKAPPRLIERLKAEAATEEPAAPVEPTEPTEPTKPTEPTEPAAAGATSFAAATYTNDEYGFSIQYPKDWVERPDLLLSPYHINAFSVSAFLPGVTMMAYDAAEPVTADWIVKSMKDAGNANPKVKSDLKEVTLSDGTKATQYELTYLSPTNYEVRAVVVDADKDGKRIRVVSWTVEAFEPFNEALQTEIANTLTFK
ncbi:MAG: ABC transporter substrate-binding protein [Chloroflexota bacterium]|nr:MAG: ABC transporter substrate-binding protein [Chloroflexota bacterium]